MELFKLDPGLAIWTWIAFGILFFILWKFAFPVLIGNIKEREKLIAKSVDDADEIEKRLKEINIEYAEIIKKARTEADGILLETRKESDLLKRKLLLKAEEEAADIVIQKTRCPKNAKHYYLHCRVRLQILFVILLHK